MVQSQSLFVYFTHASPVVKTVMLLLLAASVISWTIIIERAFFIKKVRKAMAIFENQFWSGADLNRLYGELRDRHQPNEGLSAIFTNGFKEFIRLCKQSQTQGSIIMEGVQRAMRIASNRETDRLESNLSFLATIGSISPYIGLFGTVWGIMTSFHALTNMQQATIAMVAPGISEALVATAMGLFAAIPAVIAYNRYTHQVERLIGQYETFQEEFMSILYRQTYAGNTAE